MATPVTNAAAAAAVASSSNTSAITAAALEINSTAAGRQVQLPSLFSQDLLSLILTSALSDVPAWLGQPYFPQELIRIVHEYAAELVFMAELEGRDEGTFERVTLGSLTEFLQWLGGHLPSELSPVDNFSESDPDSVYQIDDWRCWPRHNSCLMDEDIRVRYGADISRLLRAQLQSHEYRMCHLEIPKHKLCRQWCHIKESDELRLPIFKEHERYCLDELNKRKAAIVARGQTPVSVGIRDLLNRVRSSLDPGVLPRGLSSRVVDWAPLFRWIRACGLEDNERFRNVWKEVDYRGPDDACDFKPPLSSVSLLLQSAGENDAVSHRTQARLWSSNAEQPVFVPPSGRMVIEVEEEEAFLAATASSSVEPSLSSSAAAATSLSADEESAARAAPRLRRA